jgi:hypothetical protein
MEWRLGFSPPNKLARATPLLRGSERPGGGEGRCWSAPARVSHGSDLSRYDIAPVISDGSPIIVKEHPCKRAGAETMFWPATEEAGDEEGWGKGGGGTRERRHGWGGGGVSICVRRTLLFYLLAEKNYKAVTLGSFHTHFLGDCNYYYTHDPQLSQGLTVDEKSVYLRGTVSLKFLRLCLC